MSDRYGWDSDDAEELAEAIFEWSHEIELRYSERYQAIRDAYDIVGDPVDRELTSTTYEYRKPIVGGAVRALTAQLSVVPPRAMFSTVGATWDEHLAARRLTRMVDARMVDLNATPIVDAGFIDGLTAGLGCLRPYADLSWQSLCLERVHPLDIRLDDAGCTGWEPRRAAFVHLVDKYQLVERYKNHPHIAAAIEEAPPAGPWDRRRGELGENLIVVIEASQLPSAKGADDGFVATAVEGALLDKRPYHRKNHPVVWIRPLDRSDGFWGMSLVLHLWPQQRLHDNMSERLDQGVERVAIQRFFMASSDGPAEVQMDDRVGVIIKTKTGKPLHQATPPAITADFAQLMSMVESGIYDTAGSSKDFATQQRPSFKTGVGQIVYRDQQTQRNIGPARVYEQVYVDLAWEFVACERTLAKEVKGYKVPVLEGGNRRRAFPFAKLDIDDVKLRVQVFPTAALGREPSARFDKAEEMLNSGKIDLDTFWQITETPDPEGALAFFTSPARLIREVIETMLEESKYITPEPVMDLKRCVKYAALAIQHARNLGVQESRIDYVRRFLTDSGRLLNNPKLVLEILGITPPPAPAPAPEAMPAPMPGEVPMGEPAVMEGEGWDPTAMPPPGVPTPELGPPPQTPPPLQ